MRVTQNLRYKWRDSRESESDERDGDARSEGLKQKREQLKETGFAGDFE